MGDAGIFSEVERIELVDGDLVDMAPIGSQHAYVVDLMTDMLVKQVPRKYLVRIQNPIQLGEFGEPEPDVAIVKKHNYRLQHPQASDILMLIEVAETSLEYDRATKLPFYARYGIPEVWIIDLNGKRGEVYRTPLMDEQRYQSLTVYSTGYIVPDGVPEVQVSIDGLWD